MRVENNETFNMFLLTDPMETGLGSHQVLYPSGTSLKGILHVLVHSWDRDISKHLQCLLRNSNKIYQYEKKCHIKKMRSLWVKMQT